jgi:hypothetical protein
MTMQSEESDGRPATTTPSRACARDLFRAPTSARSSCRGNRRDSGDFNRVAGVDANFRFFKSFSINSFAARSDHPA